MKKLYLSAVIVILTVIFISLISCNNPEIPDPEDALKNSAFVPVRRFEQMWIDRHNQLINNVIRNQKIIFIGDSITQLWEGTEAWAALNQKYNKKITNLGFSGDQTQNVIWRLENGEFPLGINPEYVVLMIGTNNGRHSPESIALGIRKIIEIINTNSPLTRIILMSLLPRGRGNNDIHTIRNNDVNKIIKNYDGYLRTKYLNIGQYYIDNTKALRAELFIDRVHLAPAGYNIWKEKIEEIIG
jgi:lysophospholipase L1-like esterase